MTPRSYQNNFLVGQSIDQKPVRFDVALAAIKVLSTKCVVPVPRRQLLAASQACDNLKKLRNVVPALLRPLAVSLELIGPGESSHES